VNERCSWLEEKDPPWDNPDAWEMEKCEHEATHFFCGIYSNANASHPPAYHARCEKHKRACQSGTDMQEISWEEYIVAQVMES